MRFDAAFWLCATLMFANIEFHNPYWFVWRAVQWVTVTFCAWRMFRAIEFQALSVVERITAAAIAEMEAEAAKRPASGTNAQDEVDG